MSENEETSFEGRFQRFANSLGNKFEPEVRYHLAKVYTCLGATIGCSAFGSYLHLAGYLEVGLLAILASFALVLGLHFMQDDQKTFHTRLAMLLGFGFCSGQSLGPLMQHIIIVNPAIIVTALTGTVVVFLTLTAAALLAERGRYIFLGGLLVSILNTMALLSILNFFMQSIFIQQTHLYVGLGVMSAFILYDTQAIIEKVRIGNKDCIRHSLDLFFDLISVFRRLLIILTQKEERDRQNRRKNN